MLLTERLVRAAGARGIRFVLVLSSSVYGNARELPTPEHAPMSPLNPYAVSKVAAEAAVREHGADAVAGILAALRRGRAGEAYNLSGWRSVELLSALGLLEDAVGCGASLRTMPGSGAEARVTEGCRRKAAEELGYRPRIDLATGIERQVAAATSARLAA